MDKPTKCTATNRDGTPCQGTALPNGTHCFAHDERLAQQRRQWAVDAGKAKSNAARMRKSLGTGAETLALSEVDALLCTALKGVLTGKLEPGIATSAATVAKSIMAIRTASDLESRLAQLEQRAGLQVSA
ncbi:MAG: hypothetical protein ACR2M1_00965 [Gemmatimonadaceae bacterium]